MKPQTIRTIGHSIRSIGDFIALLQENAITALADVRMYPGSRRYPQFGKDALTESLAAQRIAYLHFPELGGRRRPRPDSKNTAWRNAMFRGYADYMETDAFNEGMQRLLRTATHQPTAIMCAEALWWQCHRSLISDWLKSRGHDVIHILGPGKTEQHPYTSPARIVNGELSYQATNQRELAL